MKSKNERAKFSSPRAMSQALRRSDTTTLASDDWSPDAEFLTGIVAAVRDTVITVAPDSETTGRIKNSHSTSSKQRRFQNQVRSIHDKVGVRIIVRDLAHCFAAIERLHQKMPHLEELYDDYITYPKDNGYQSLHTTIIAENGWPCEVQVRTREMHELAEKGTAAHQNYKDRLKPGFGAGSFTKTPASLTERSAQLVPARCQSWDAAPQTERGCLEGRVAFVSTYPPVSCTVADYTASLTQALQTLCPRSDCFVVAMSPTRGQHHYAEQIHYQIRADDIRDYRAAAEFLNGSNVLVLSLQHDYRIFGGAHGAHVLSLLRAVRIPLVTTLHTVERNPTLVQQAILNEVCALSEGLVVSNAELAARLESQHDVPARKITTIGLSDPRLDADLFGLRPKPLSPTQWETVASRYLRSFHRALDGFTNHSKHGLDASRPKGATIR